MYFLQSGRYHPFFALRVSKQFYELKMQNGNEFSFQWFSILSLSKLPTADTKSDKGKCYFLFPFFIFLIFICLLEIFFCYFVLFIAHNEVSSVNFDSC